MAVGNRADHHVPYLYTYAGQPWKTQKRVREILDKMYRGLVYTGMDDCGEMAAWYVWSAMGFYPVCPPHLVYPIGSPIFDRVTVHLPAFYGGGRWEVVADQVSEKNLYIQSVTLNGKSHPRPWISFYDVVNGGSLVLHMGPEPDTTWGSNQEDAPPSEPVLPTRAEKQERN